MDNLFCLQNCVKFGSHTEMFRDPGPRANRSGSDCSAGLVGTLGETRYILPKWCSLRGRGTAAGANEWEYKTKGRSAFAGLWFPSNTPQAFLVRFLLSSYVGTQLPRGGDGKVTLEQSQKPRRALKPLRTRVSGSGLGPAAPLQCLTPVQTGTRPCFVRPGLRVPRWKGMRHIQEKKTTIAQKGILFSPKGNACAPSQLMILRCTLVAGPLQREKLSHIKHSCTGRLDRVSKFHRSPLPLFVRSRKPARGCSINYTKPIGDILNGTKGRRRCILPVPNPTSSSLDSSHASRCCCIPLSIKDSSAKRQRRCLGWCQHIAGVTAKWTGGGHGGGTSILFRSQGHGST